MAFPKFLQEKISSHITNFGPPLSWGYLRIKDWLKKTLQLNRQIKVLDLEKVKLKQEYASNQETTWSKKLIQNRAKDDTDTIKTIVRIAREKRIKSLEIHCQGICEQKYCSSQLCKNS